MVISVLILKTKGNIYVSYQRNVQTSRQILKIPASNLCFFYFFLLKHFVLVAKITVSQILFQLQRAKACEKANCPRSIQLDLEHFRDRAFMGCPLTFFACFELILLSTNKIMMLFYFCSSASNLFCGFSITCVKIYIILPEHDPRIRAAFFM